MSPQKVARLCQPWIPQARLTQPWHDLICAGCISPGLRDMSETNVANPASRFLQSPVTAVVCGLR